VSTTGTARRPGRPIWQACMFMAAACHTSHQKPSKLEPRELRTHHTRSPSRPDSRRRPFGGVIGAAHPRPGHAHLPVPRVTVLSAVGGACGYGQRCGGLRGLPGRPAWSRTARRAPSADRERRGTAADASGLRTSSAHRSGRPTLGPGGQPSHVGPSGRRARGQARFVSVAGFLRRARLWSPVIGGAPHVTRRFPRPAIRQRRGGGLPPQLAATSQPPQLGASWADKPYPWCGFRA
jgi:hypothetical protein